MIVDAARYRLSCFGATLCSVQLNYSFERKQKDAGPSRNDVISSKFAMLGRDTNARRRGEIEAVVSEAWEGVRSMFDGSRPWMLPA